jgi:hypothetical protein
MRRGETVPAFHYLDFLKEDPKIEGTMGSENK